MNLDTNDSINGFALEEIVLVQWEVLNQVKMLEEYSSKHVQWVMIEKIRKGYQKDEVEVVDECAFEGG